MRGWMPTAGAGARSPAPKLLGFMPIVHKRFVPQLIGVRRRQEPRRCAGPPPPHLLLV